MPFSSPMQNSEIPLPGIEKISILIDALRNYAVKSTRECWEEQLTDTYRAPSLTSWDACMWFDLLQDWELSYFLISGTDKAMLLLKSLQSCLQWYGQTESEKINSRLKIMSMSN